jgi:hypothetical protein
MEHLEDIVEHYDPIKAPISQEELQKLVRAAEFLMVAYEYADQHMGAGGWSWELVHEDRAL